MLEPQTAPETLIDSLETLLGPGGIVRDKADIVERAAGWSRFGTPYAVLRPGSTEEVAAAVKLCTAAGHAVVPWGGKTGLASGGFADNAFAISLDRMNRIESLDAGDGTMLVEAGCILQTACEAAEAEGMFFPLDLGARGSATIGGVISTNAGGNRVVRFGMMRDLVLGVEAVLADGTIVSSLQPLIKNNTGYDLKQLFIGSEGTLGIVTRAVLRLRPQLPSRNSALVAVDGFPNVVRLLRALEAKLGGQLSAFEVMWREFYDLVTMPPAHGRPIVPHGHAFYVLVEALGGDLESDLARFEAALVETLEEGYVADAVIAQSQGEVERMWALRDDAEQVQRDGPTLAFDVSLRLSDIDAFTSALRALLDERWPGTSLVLFGHIGDGNIHTVVGLTEDTPARRADMTKAVLSLLGQYRGSVSAEHGIGLDKRDYLPLSRSAEELGVMRLIKQALDPKNLLNPGKVLAPVE